MKVAIIGVSGFGETHYKDIMGWHEKGRLEVLAATVINQDEEKEKCEKLLSAGSKIYTDYMDMIRNVHGEVDICFIPTGIHLHKPMTIAALEAGINVFVEKPVAATVQELDEMKEVEKRTGKFVAVGYQSIYTPEVRKIKKAIIEDCIGKIKSIKCMALWPRTESYYARNNWAGKIKSGKNWVLDSPFNNALSHQLNMLCFFAGTQFANSAEIDSVEAELYRGNKIESADTACIRINTSTGIPLYFFVSHACENLTGPHILIAGEKGRILWNPANAEIITENETEKIKCRNWNEMRLDIMESLERRLTDKTAFICSLEIAGAQTLCVNGAHESSRIIPLEAGLLDRKHFENSFLTVIHGIDEIIAESFEKEKLFSEIGVPWAVKGKKTDLRNYHFFPSRQ